MPVNSKAGLRRSGTSSTGHQTRLESKKIFRKIDADKGGSVDLKEVQEFIARSNEEKQWLDGKLKKLAERLDKPPEETARVAAKVSLELATGKTGAEAHEAELTQEEFHQFRKKYMIDPAGAEEVFQRCVFSFFDADGSGELEEDELDHLLETIFDAPGTKDVSRRSFTMAEMKDVVMENLDVNGDKTLSFKELRGVISGGATALRAMRHMKLEEQMEASKRSASEKDPSQRDDEEEDEDDNEDEESSGDSSEADPRAMASRLLELLETPEEAEEAAIERERLEAAEESDDEDEKDKEGEIDDNDDEDEEDKPEEEHTEIEPTETEFTEREEDTNLAGKHDLRNAGLGLMAYNQIIDRTKRKGQRNVQRDSEGSAAMANSGMHDIDLNQENIGTREEEREHLDVKVNQGLILRDFPMPEATQTENPQEAGIVVHKSKEVEDKDDESEEFDVCTWLDKKLSPSSYDRNGHALGGRKPMCQRESCAIM